MEYFEFWLRLVLTQLSNSMFSQTEFSRGAAMCFLFQDRAREFNINFGCQEVVMPSMNGEPLRSPFFAKQFEGGTAGGSLEFKLGA